MCKSRNAREGHYFGKVGGQHRRCAGAGKWNLRLLAYTWDGIPLKMNRGFIHHGTSTGRISGAL